MIKVNALYNFVSGAYQRKTAIERVLIQSCLFGISLSFFRVLYTGQLMFLSLIWNLFLGLIPYLVTQLIMRYPECVEHKKKFYFAFLIWLLFIPNSFYIITDLFHLQERNEVPMWFDLALIFSFAWNGLLLGVLSMRHMERIWEIRWKWTELFFVYPVMCLNAFGIYLGRYLRYNSWDVVSDPFSLLNDILYLIIHPIRNRFDWSMIFCYAVFMSLIYLSLKRIGKE